MENTSVQKDIEICNDIIKEKYPDYIKSFDDVFKKHSFYAFNMFIAKKEIINNYCKWLFDILFEVEKRVDISTYDKYNQRLFGFLSERLFNVWLTKNNQIIIKQENVFQTDENLIKQKITYYIKKILVKFIEIFDFIKKK